MGLIFTMIVVAFVVLYLADYQSKKAGDAGLYKDED